MTDGVLFPVEPAGRPRSLWALLQEPPAEPGPTEPLEVIVTRTCRYCRCTDDRACEGGCWWIADDVCSRCGDAARADGIEVGGIRRGLCPRCAGCGRIADDEGGTPWSYWAALPAGSNLAVVLGIVEPLTCPDCDGRGTRSPNLTASTPKDL